MRGKKKKSPKKAKRDVNLFLCPECGEQHGGLELPEQCPTCNPPREEEEGEGGEGN